MSAAVPCHPPLQMARLEKPETIDEVVRNIDRVIDWAIKAESHIGYFAALYKRTTVAIRQAINEGVFDDGPRMQQLDVVFATRYFNALNAYFYPGEYQSPTIPWEVAFVGDQYDKPIILQQMMTGLNAHITFDLGLAVVAIAANSLKTLDNDFNRINAILASQVPGTLDVIGQLSPDLRWIRRLIPEVWVIRQVLKKLRKSAWYFAIYLAMHPDNAREKQVNQAAWTAALGAWYLQPPKRFTPFPRLVRVIAKRESRNVAANIRALEGITNTPDKMDKAFLLPPVR
jgi:hypothetical protein